MRRPLLILFAAIAIAASMPLTFRDSQAQVPLPSPGGGLFRTEVLVPTQDRAVRLEGLGVTKIAGDEPGPATVWVVLTDELQLESLVRLGFRPEQTSAIGQLDTSGAGLIFNAAFRALVTAAGDAEDQDPANPDVAALQRLAQTAALLDQDTEFIVANLQAGDSDADGLTDTQESWWCTDPFAADSDADGTSDGLEAAALRAWAANDIFGVPASTGRAPSTGKPFLDWPMKVAGSPCVDSDFDSVPDLAERWELGLNANRESTDLDKFDDGQELFGITYCPGSGAFCGHGALPRDDTGGAFTNSMPSFVKAPGNHPMVAAFPIPEIDVIEGSLRVRAVTTVTSSNTITEGTERSYSTSKTEGTSTSVADTVTWNEWQEVSTTNGVLLAQRAEGQSASDDDLTKARDEATNKVIAGGVSIFLGGLAGAGACLTGVGCPAGLAATVVGVAYGAYQVYDGVTGFVGAVRNKYDLSGSTYRQPSKAVLATAAPQEDVLQDRWGSVGISHTVALADGGPLPQVQSAPMVEVRSPARIDSQTNTSGSSRGGAQTTTHETYEEHTVTNGEAFLNQTAWGTATAVDSVHAADLWFTYRVKNAGTEYAREIDGLVFNVYLGDSDSPIYSYFVDNDAAAGDLQNLAPGENHQYVSQRIPLTLDQMKALDLGAKLRVVVEDFSYGLDEFFYADAAASGVMLAIEDGTADGAEEIDRYLVPTWANPDGTPEKALDVLARYFPHTTDDLGQLNAIWTPEYRGDTPSWCDQPKATGLGSQRTLWCRHALSVADWWNIYTDGLGDGSEGMQDSAAVPGALALFRFNSDSDLDGYSDRSERRLGTNPNDATSFPRPELLAGVSCDDGASTVTCTLSLLNTGVYDAYGVEAIMVSPDATTAITNNTVGGSGRVKAGRQVIVGSHLNLVEPLQSAWRQPGHASPAVGGYYTGDVDRTIAFSVACPLSGGCQPGQGTWSLAWNDGTGSTGSVQMGAGYAAPSLVAAVYGLKVGLQSGRVFNGESFSVAATTPRDTFQFTKTGPGFTHPVVIVSYNDPQGNHRFIVPTEAMDLASPSDNLAGFAGQMLEDPGIEIITDAEFTPGANTTTLLANNPSSATLMGAQAHLVFIDLDGNPVEEVTQTFNLIPGPNAVDVPWSSTNFDTPYDPGSDYLVMAFLTDSEGNILDAGGRPLSSFQVDPVADQETGNLAWSFGTEPRGVVLAHTFSLGSVGARELLAYVDSSSAPAGMTVSGPSPSSLGPGDAGKYTVFLDTSGLPEAPFSASLPLRTSDPDAAPLSLSITGVISGQVTGGGPGAPGAALRPLDVPVIIAGDHAQGESFDFTHTLGSDAASLHPIAVYSEDYSAFKGMGRLAPLAPVGPVFGEFFGTGDDGVFPGGDPNSVRSALRASPLPAGVTVPAVSSTGFAAGDEVLVIQSRGTNAGLYEFGTVASTTPGGDINLTAPLANTYIQDAGANKAQVLKVPNFTTVTGALTTGAWNGADGGILVFRAWSVNATSIDVSGKGYRGGTPSLGAAPGAGQHGKQGEGTAGPSGGATESPNGNGGGGGFGNEGGDGGGGGGHALAGTNGDQRGAPLQGGQGGLARGSASLDAGLFFGGAGGSGGGEGNAGSTSVSGAGGNGGGIALVFAREFSVTNGISANGAAGGAATRQEEGSGGGGGGGGGTILVRANTVSLGTSTTALGGAPGPKGRPGTGDSGDGGAGSSGRIRVEYCSSLLGTSVPAASTQQVDCYIVDQTAPSAAQLTIPESFTGGRTYQVQYGRVVAATPAGVTTSLRVPAGQWSNASFHALISDAGAGSVTMSLDIGANGSAECTFTGAVDTGVDHACDAAAVVQAFNDWWSTYGGSGLIDVPIRVSLSQPGQVILTDLQMVPADSVETHIRLGQGSYATVALDLVIGDTGAGPVVVGVDVGADGDIDWQQSFESVAFPVHLTTGNIAAGVNAITAAAGAPVNVPIRIYTTPAIGASINGFTAVPTARPDLRHASAVSVSPLPAHEGDILTVTANVTNPGPVAEGVAVSFFATAPFFGRTYIGSDFLPSVGSGGGVASIQWDTVGFYGSVTVEAVIDAYNRIPESNESNNTSSTVVSVMSRPDLEAIELTTADPSGIAAGEAGSLLVLVRNNGQATTPAATVTVYDGDPGNGGVAVGTGNLPSLAGAGSKDASGNPTDRAKVPVTWSAAGSAGEHAIVVFVDEPATPGGAGLVVESNENNNRRTFQLPVGFAGPVAVDSGSGADILYTPAIGHGAVDEPELSPGVPSPFADILASCGPNPDDSLRLDPNGAVRYQFDHLLPSRFYHLDLVLYECGSGLGRTETVSVDGTRLSDAVDLGDGAVHRLSLRLDPALYVDRSILVEVMSPEGLGAVVSQVSLHDIDYRYADSGLFADGGARREISYAESQGPRRYGYLDGTPVQAWGQLPYQTGRTDLLDASVRYRFDGLDPAKLYDMRLTFFIDDGRTRVQDVTIDGNAVLEDVSIVDGTPVSFPLPRVQVPPATYADGTITVEFVRQNTNAPIVNEVAIEQRTSEVTDEGIGPALVFVQHPASALTGVLLDVTPTVQLLDENGQPATGDNQSLVTLSIAGGPGVLTCQQSQVTVTSGLASFPGCFVSSSGNYTLVASADSLPGEATAPLPVEFAVSNHRMSAVAVGSETAVFARTVDDALWVRETAGGAFGSPWQVVVESQVGSRPVAVVRGSEVFAFYRGTGGDLRYAHRATGSSTWTEHSLGGQIVDGLAAAVDGDGDVIVVVLNAAGAIYYQRFGATGWNGWQATDGILTGRMSLTAFQGNVHLFGVNAAGSLWTRKWNAASNAWEPWFGLDGIVIPSPTSAASGSRLTVAAMSPGGGTWYREFDGSSWQAWTSLGGILASAPALVAMPGGETALLGVNPAGAIWMRQTTAGAWGAWTPVDGSLTSGPAVAGIATGAYLFGASGDGTVWARALSSGSWQSWSNLAGRVVAE